MSHVIWSGYFHMVTYYVSNLWSLAGPKDYGSFGLVSLRLIWLLVRAGIPQLETMFQNQHNQLIYIPVGTLS